MKTPVSGLSTIKFSKIGGLRMSRPLYAVMIFVGDLSLIHLHLHATDHGFFSWMW